MTDNEIIKAKKILHDLHAYCFCSQSTFRAMGYNFVESDFDCLKELIDLINRQQTEIERLREEKQAITDNFNCQQTVYLDLSEIIKKQANELKTAKSEAIKEFAERLKSKMIAAHKKQRGILCVRI